MIPMYIALGIFFICGIYLLATWKKETPLDKPFIVAVVIAAAFCFAAFCLSLENSANTDAEYEQLMLYKEIVEETNDEAVRFDFYQRVQEWNENYIAWYELENSNWSDWTISDNKYSENVGLIDFDLRRG